MTDSAAAIFLAYFTAALVVAWLVFSYNRLVRRRNLVKEGWSGIDVQLKRRHDLVPNLVETVRGYADFERSVLEDVTRLRSEAEGGQAPGELVNTENALAGRIRTLFALAEDHPQLLANRSFLDLQKQLTEVEDHLQYARRYYNGAVRDLNIAVESFPSNLVAGVFRFRTAEFFEVESATDRAAPEVSL